MDRSFFRRSSRDTSPLLPQHSSSRGYPLADIPPHPYTDSPTQSRSSSRQSQASASPLQAPLRPHVQFSYPPPPVVSSVLLNAHRPSVLRSESPSITRPQVVPSMPIASNPLMSLSRREKAIQSDLQFLLDAQSAGLAQGRIGEDTNSDAGSSTPKFRSLALSPSRSHGSRGDSQNRGVGVIPVRQPGKKRIGLNGARKGILNAMLELSAVKAHEETVVDSEMTTLCNLLKRVSRWESKISSFSQEMQRINDEKSSYQISDLKSEKSAVEFEILEAEERLLRLQTRERQISRRIEEVENRKEAELSSFRNGKKEIEAEVDGFMKRPPVLEVTIAVLAKIDDATRRESDITEAQGFLSLPPKRRTLEMARSWFESSLTALETYRRDTERERIALDEGAGLWKAATMRVMGFERDLKEQMQAGTKLDILDLRSQLERMDVIVDDLATKAGEVEGKGWNLLICALGAELEVFKEGRGLLMGVLKQADPSYPKIGGRTDGEAEEVEGNEERQGGQDSGVYEDAKESHSRNHSGLGESFLVKSTRNDTALTAALNGSKDLGLDSQQDGQEKSTSASPSASVPRSGEQGKENANDNARTRILMRDPSPYREDTESEDDGPPAALLVGIGDDDDV